MNSPHPTRPHAALHILCAIAASIAIAAGSARLSADDDVSDLMQSAKPVTTAPMDTPATQPAADLPDALGTLKPRPPAGARQAAVTLNNGVTLAGPVWTTLATPFRVWVDATKSYRDLDPALLKRIDVKVLSESLEDDWRWLKEGSDQKIFSGKKYPLVELAYTFTLTNDQTIEGTVVAPIYMLEGPSQKQRTLALYKKYKGPLGETLKDVTYIKTILFQPAPSTAEPAVATTKLPLLY